MCWYSSPFGRYALWPTGKIHAPGAELGNILSSHVLSRSCVIATLLVDKVEIDSLTSVSFKKPGGFICTIENGRLSILHYFPNLPAKFTAAKEVAEEAMKAGYLQGCMGALCSE